MHMNRESLSTSSSSTNSDPIHTDEPADPAGDTPVLCVPGLVREQARLAPQALAVRDAKENLTYGELDHHSNQLAHYLRGRGVVPGTLIGLCLERSSDWVTAALAIFKAGCAYLPLDPATPRERLAAMLKDAQVSVVVTSSSVEGSLAGEKRELVSIDRCAAEIGGCSSGVVPASVTPEHLAYVIYTSGSTGTPKGVAIGHDSLLNLVRWHNRTFAVTPKDRASQLASMSFDAAVWEIWPYLTAGASVHLVDDEIRTQPRKLRDWIVQEAITISFAPTPLAERMMKLTWPAETALRFLLTGADTLHQYPPADLPFTLVNNYGPTECTVVATSAPVSPDQSSNRLPSIGAPIDNTQIYILDRDRKPVPEGQIGEIYIGGASLARGYFNHAELTAESFVPNPLSEVSGERLYRTGDLGCCLADGQIAFHGRLDGQVKILGYRIDPSEIVSVLDRLPEVEAGAVVAREESPGEKRLVAYIVPSSSVGLKDSVLRGFLRQYLPEYMLPGIFVRVDSLPVNANGKLDRAALPVPDVGNIIRDEAWVAPRTEVEQKVAALLAPLLHIENIGVNDNFFLLGGNSLLGTQVINRVSLAFGVDLTLLALFDHPSVAGISEQIETLLAADLPQSTYPPPSSEPASALGFAGSGLVAGTELHGNDKRSTPR